MNIDQQRTTLRKLAIITVTMHLFFIQTNIFLLESALFMKHRNVANVIVCRENFFIVIMTVSHFGFMNYKCFLISVISYIINKLLATPHEFMIWVLLTGNCN